MLSYPRHSFGAGVLDNLAPLLFDLQQGDGVDEARHEARRAAGLTPHNAQQPRPGETQTPPSEQQLQQQHLQRLGQQQQQYQQQYQQQLHQQQYQHQHQQQQQLLLQQQELQLQQQLRQVLQQNPSMVLELDEQQLQALNLQHLLPSRHQQVEPQQHAQQLPAQFQAHAQQQQPWRQFQQINEVEAHGDAHQRAVDDEMLADLQLDGMEEEILYSAGGGFDSHRTPRSRSRSSSLNLNHLHDNMQPESDDKRARMSSAAACGLKTPLAQPSMVLDIAFGTGPHAPRKLHIMAAPLIDRSALAAKVSKPTLAAAAAAVAVAAAAAPKPKPKLACANPAGAIAEGSKRQPTSSYRGVCWYKRTKRWVVQIKVNGLRRHVGYFKDELTAAIAYDKALEEACSPGDAAGLPKAPKAPKSAKPRPSCP
jgi:hypothetical protein